MLVCLKMFHAVLKIAFTGAAIPELHHRVIILGHAAYRAVMYRSFFERHID